MNEYLETLRILASNGDTQAAIDLILAESHLNQIRKTTQRIASNLRSRGEDVDYLNNDVGEISFGDRDLTTLIKLG